MPNLKIPQSGLSFDSVSERSSKSTTQDIIGLTLTDDLIEEMIQCVQNGKQIHLSLGPRPNLSFGNTTQQLADYKDPFAHEIYHASQDPTSNNDIVMAPAGKPCTAFQKMFNPRYAAKMAASYNASVAATAKSVTAGVDNARENLEKSMAAAQAKKQGNTPQLIPLNAGGKKSKLMSQQGRLNDSNRSMPSSPALSGLGSPSLGPTSIPASQMITEKAKINRRSIVHLLAVRPMTEKELRKRVDDLTDNEFKQALEKVSDKVQNGQEYELFKMYYKELDVWSFNYDSEEDRQKAINNAIKQYDRLRIAPADDEWERLKPMDKRGDGQSLSKVQARIAQGPIPRTPKINVSNADSGRDTPGQDSDAPAKKALNKVMKDSANRSSTQPAAAGKNKRISEKEAQTKRLLSTKAKPSQVPAQKKETAVKASTAAKASTTKPLSNQFVTDSDDEAAAITTAKPKPAPKKPLGTQKRPREEPGNDSSQPVSKKARAGNGKSFEPAAENNHKSFSQNSSSNVRTKGTSPQKSSPLASSPPTNASDFASSANSSAASDSSTPRHNSNFASKTSRSPIHKRNASSSSLSSASSASSLLKVEQATLQLAQDFLRLYPKYEALHRELNQISQHKRDPQKVDELCDLHDKLVSMKARIHEDDARMSR